MNGHGAVVGQPSRLSSRASRPRRILGRDAPMAGGTPAPLPRGSWKERERDRAAASLAGHGHFRGLVTDLEQNGQRGLFARLVLDRVAESVLLRHPFGSSQKYLPFVFAFRDQDSVQ